MIMGIIIFRLNRANYNQLTLKLKNLDLKSIL